ncbi:MAG: AMP-binding protein, partial [Planctomycetes bacterium]|nr:AMP-binding protein [Planctomycetota bacterium]
MEKMALNLDAELVYLEDLRDDLAKAATLGDKLASYWEANFKSASSLERKLGLDKIDSKDVVTVIFTSGSTGIPKGVMLTHGNISHNIEAIEQLLHLRPDDVMVCILPFFHSFGYAMTLWGAMGLDIKGCYHFSPLDGKEVGKLTHQHQGTLLLSTPTFLRTFLKRCTKEQFSTLDVVVTGAEKLPVELGDAFEEQFGVRPVEGYGCTETSPLVSLNIPKSRAHDNVHVGCKEGAVGRPVPSVIAKTTHLDSGKELGSNEPGMLWVKGPNVMKGYLKRVDLTHDVIVDGWYKTGDVALLDDDGFIKITGRISRFSKIGGEMVPHIQIEDTLTELIGADEEEGLKAVVTAIPDIKKGERLIVIHTQLEQSVGDLRKGLSEEGLANICIPSADSFHLVDEIPILGTGKFDLKGIQQVAMAQFGSEK